MMCNSYASESLNTLSGHPLEHIESHKVGRLKAHYSPMCYVDDKLLFVLIFWLKRFIDWLRRYNWNV